MLTNVSYNYQPMFGVNLKSPKLRLSKKDFYIKIPGYGKNSEWASVVKKTTDEAVKNIRENWDSDWVLFGITKGIKEANQAVSNTELGLHTGVLRAYRPGWEYGSEWTGSIFATPYIDSKYKFYEKRLDNAYDDWLKSPYDDLKLSRPIKSKKIIFHPAPEYINNAFKHVENIYQFIQENFIRKEITPKDIDKANEKIAEIRWILAHVMPWERGSDSISNVFMRAIYKAIGVKAYPPAKGVSYDLEAFCTNLDEYKTNFPQYFEKPPEVIE